MQKSITDFLSKESKRQLNTNVHLNTHKENASALSPYVKKRRSYVPDDFNQYTLDAGQKNIGTQFCEQVTHSFFNFLFF